MTMHISHNELHNELHPRFSPRRVLVCNWACRDWAPIWLAAHWQTADLLAHYWLTIPFSPEFFPALNLSTTLSAPAQLTHSVLTVYGCSFHYFSTEVRVQQAFDYQMVYLCEPSMERLFHRHGKKRCMNHTQQCCRMHYSCPLHVAVVTI